jgi:glyoxylase-like metal-dependent hydrolase (beta-lactamase superfamily II)
MRLFPCLVFGTIAPEPGPIVNKPPRRGNFVRQVFAPLPILESLGFKITDVKILLASHAHSVHVAGHARLQKLSGAKVYVMRGDDQVIASGGKGSYCRQKIFTAFAITRWIVRGIIVLPFHIGGWKINATRLVDADLTAC